MKNNLADLNNHLFSMLEELNSDEQMNQEDFDKLIKKAKAINSVSTQILKVANLQVLAIKTAENCGLLNKELPALIATKDSQSESAARQKLLGVAK